MESIYSTIIGTRGDRGESYHRVPYNGTPFWDYVGKLTTNEIKLIPGESYEVRHCGFCRHSDSTDVNEGYCICSYIDSATKTFTAMLISRAVEEGKINLDDNISNYLELENRYYPTIKRIITHTSGFKPYYLSFQKIKNYFSGGNDFYNISKEQLLKELNKTKLEDKDYDFNYSNFGISTLGLILEKVYYKDYNELQEEYFKELDMNNTSVAIGKGNLRGYWKWNEDDGYIPTGAIISNIEDMSKYLETLITSDESYIIKTQEPLTDVRAVNDIYNIFDINVDKVGMTWMIDNKNDIIWHNGSTTNFNSYIGYNKEKKVGVVVLSNLSPKSDVNMTFIGNKILHEMLDK